jgi:hypothetical protein
MARAMGITDSDFSHFLLVAKPTANIIIPIIRTTKILRIDTVCPPLLKQAGFLVKTSLFSLKCFHFFHSIAFKSKNKDDTNK